MPITPRDVSRFIKKILLERSGCHVWIGCKFDRPGDHVYGSFRLDGRSIGAHRASWMIFRGEIPEGMHVLHHCDNCLCVNPSHLFLGTQADNNHDKNSKGRQYRGDRHHCAVLSMEQANQLRREYDGGASTYTLSQRYGINQSVAYAIVTGKTWRGPGEQLCKTHRPRAKITPEQRDEIIAAIQSGARLKDLCARYGIKNSGMVRYANIARGNRNA